MLYRGLGREALDVAYDNTNAVGMEKRNAYISDWVKRSETVSNAWSPRSNISYGSRPRQRLDVFPCGSTDAPTLLYIHGGYWQMGDKEAYGFIGDALLASGFNFVLVEYTLAPEVQMDDIVSEIYAAIDWVIEKISKYGGDPRRVFICGHSAGGHLTAMAMNDRRIAGGIAISGLFDLEPIRLNYLNQKLGLDEAEMLRNSPIRHIPAESSPLIVTVGLDELPELIRQSEDYYNAWQSRGHDGQYLPIPGHDHFSVLEELARADGLILKALKNLAVNGGKPEMMAH